MDKSPESEVVMSGLLTRIHINQHIIKRNAKYGENSPVITVKTYDTNEYFHEVAIYCPDCSTETARVVYRPDKPLSCGAKVWIECRTKVQGWVKKS
jgi:hypothetical protein